MPVRFPQQHNASTLLEILAAVVLIGLIAVTVVPDALLRHQRTSSRVSAVAHLRDFDQRARMAAIGSGGMMRLGFAEVEARFGTEQWVEPCSSTIEVRWLVAGRPTSRLALDRNGRSEDLSIEFIEGDERTWFLVSGLTGQWSPGGQDGKPLPISPSR